jgi:spore coat polysaccharide biosynthesis predicted glycosyltransferase SpsG
LTGAGAEIGFGHLTRCNALAEALEQNGILVSKFLLDNNFQPDAGWSVLPWIEEPASVLQRVSEATVVIIDSYLAEASHYNFFKKKGLKVVAIDDFNRIPYPVDLIINPNVFIEDMDYANQTAPVIGGKAYVVLRKPFRQPPEDNFVPAKPERVLVTLGGSIYEGLLLAILNALSLLPELKLVAIVPDKSFGPDERISVTVLEKQDEKGMRKEIIEADIVISACGQTLHELAALGKPTVGICLGIDQIPNRNYYLKEGFLDTQIDWDQPDLGVALVEAVRALFPKESRMHKKQLGPSLIDVNGVTNLASLIHQRFFHAV